MEDSVINKDTIDVDLLNAAISTKALVIMPDTCMDTYSEPACVTNIKKHNRKRVDGKQRYILEFVSYEDADPCYCEDGCGCGGGSTARWDATKPLTSVEIAEQFYFYPQYRIQLES